MAKGLNRGGGKAKAPDVDVSAALRSRRARSGRSSATWGATLSRWVTLSPSSRLVAVAVVGAAALGAHSSACRANEFVLDDRPALM